tara:strand:+ start:142 stop:555 length:414 start_codon:yes stop_codon:yes gene_type:complete
MTEKKPRWRPIPRFSRQIPFGYEQDPDDPDILNPIEEQLEALEQAKEYLKTCSFREVARWLSATTGRRISFQGLHKIVRSEKKRKDIAKLYHYYATKAKECAEKEKLIQSRLIYVAEEDRVPPVDISSLDEGDARAR